MGDKGGNVGPAVICNEITHVGRTHRDVELRVHQLRRIVLDAVLLGDELRRARHDLHQTLGAHLAAGVGIEFAFLTGERIDQRLLDGLAHLLEHDRLGRTGHAAGHRHAHDPRGRAQQCNPTLWVAALSTSLRRCEQSLCFVAAERGGAARLEVFTQPRTRLDAAAERPRQRVKCAGCTTELTAHAVHVRL